MATKLHFRILYLILGISFASIKIPQVNAQTTHPFLIVQENMYPSLQDRANLTPWREMKLDAINTCSTLNYLDAQNQPPLQKYKGYRVRDIAGACALAYILDITNRPVYTNKLLATFNSAWPDIRAAQIAEPISYDYQPPVASGFFHALLALDIIHDDLSPEILTQQEEFLYDQFVYFSTRPIYYRYSPMGAAVATAWLIYKRNENIPPHPSCDPSWECCTDRACWKNLYLNGRNQSVALDGMFDRVSDSGIYREGSLYAYTAFSHIRDERTFLIDVLEFTHEDNSLYSNPRFKNLYEWLYGFASAPNGFLVPFGDTSDFQRIYDTAENVASFIDSAATLRSFRFSAIAGEYALWRLGQNQLPGRLLHYLFIPYPFPSNIRRPNSRLFADGGAFFIEPDATTSSLYGAMWNLKTNAVNDVHKHKDTNALYISGYGEQLLVNVGFCGLPNSCSKYTDDGLYNRAVLNNTALIDYAIGNPSAPSTYHDHKVEKVGGGLVGGFTNPQTGFDYALGDSGPALPNGNHQRAFIFIHPRGSIPGYFIVFDQITPSDGSTKVHLTWHPHTDNILTRLNNTLFESYPGPTRNPNVLVNSTAGLSIFLATPPTNVDLLPGVLAHWVDFNQFQSYMGEYLFTTYSTPPNQTKNVATILFPFDSQHPVPIMSNISNPDSSGVLIQHGTNIFDTALESPNTTSEVYNNGVTFKGAATWYRTEYGQINSYFVKNGTRFDDHMSLKQGFDSLAPISVHFNQANGSVISSGTNVTFYYPGLTGIRLNNQLLTPLTSGDGWIQVFIPAGTHIINLQTNINSPTPTPAVTCPTADAIVTVMLMAWIIHSGLLITMIRSR
ncbi:hypothetical protein A2154_03645 [Candidatus Gottesmanbacteria bacterium RBG_16_43_7]|uniref:Heparinase II N-terminal domain-containing protein n=1 Tax=Candidatus Gottesmanbacteria bacterium RBG_16_43_7 TaxID=1798373 RepID=A0A1F5ZE46_9BACT|nr:MAG: hypothetical protein A2154_03645 [Candidatus Gottesmanbacteria bacterium RBG_16_43_7]